MIYFNIFSLQNFQHRSSPTQSDAEARNHYIHSTMQDIIFKAILQCNENRRGNRVACFGKIDVKLFLRNLTYLPDCIEHIAVCLMENIIIYIVRRTIIFSRNVFHHLRHNVEREIQYRAAVHIQIVVVAGVSVVVGRR